MPPKRRASGPTAASRPPSTRQQGMLTFHGRQNKVTKPSAPPPSSKPKGASPPVAKADALASPPAASADLPAAAAEPDPSEPTTAAAEAARVDGAPDADEQAARRVGAAQVRAYWRAKEGARKAPRVHQEGLALHEKVLREWDMSGQYGPCIGIARMERWKRAQRIGLRPPLEVLAVLLMEQRADGAGAQRAHVDELLSGRFIET